MTPAVDYEEKLFVDNVVHRSKYHGTPSAELDALWEGLYGEAGFTLVDQPERLPNKTALVPKAGGKGVVQFEVFHQLHCLV